MLLAAEAFIMRGCFQVTAILLKGEILPLFLGITQICVVKREGVGTIDNRPSTDRFHHFVRFFLVKKNDM